MEITPVQGAFDRHSMLPRIVYSSLEAMKNYKLGPDELRRLQAKKLRRMLRYCYDYFPMYHEWFRGRGLTPEDIREPKDLRLLPKLSRENLIGSPPRMIKVPSTPVDLVRLTSGTMGPRIKILWSSRFYDMHMGLTFRKTWVDGVRPWHKAAVIWTGPPESPTATAGAAKRSLARVYKLFFGAADFRVLVLRQDDFFVLGGNSESVATSLHSFRPDIIYARPSHARRLGIKLRERGQSLVPKLLLTSSEFMSDSARRDIAALYDCEVFDSYGSNEMGTIGFECPEHSGMHLNSDCLVFEFERDSEEVSPGESGEIVITGLHNQAMPLIRYEQGDRVVLEEEGRCNCGSYLPRLRAIQGRSSDGLVAADGTWIPLGVICDHLEGVFGIRDYQLIQRSRERMTLKLLSRYNTEQTVGELSRYLSSLLGRNSSLEIEEWSEDDMPAKYRPVISV